MITFGAALILVGELFLFLCLLFLLLELRRNFLAIQQTHIMINLFMDELLHPSTFDNLGKDENK